MTALPKSLGDAAFLRTPSVKRVLALLNGGGEEARVVGGAVRNALMGLPVADIDIATTALPQVVMARARNAGIQAVPTGFEHGTVTLVVDGAPHEVTTLREDVETDGRRAVVRFGRDFARDAFRRDFTINALSVNAAGELFDYASGMADIAARRVRFIGDADARIREDYLRILRFFRFSAAYGDGALEAEGMAAVVRGRDGLDRLSRERVRQETMKLLVAPGAVAIVTAMDGAGFLPAVLGGAGDGAGLARMATLEGASGLRADALRRLAGLAVTSAADAIRLRDRLRLTNAEMIRLEAMTARRRTFAEVIADPDGLAMREALYRLGPEAYRDCLLYDWARAGTDPDDPAWTAAWRLPEVWTPPAFLITGKHVMSAGVPKGPMVGRILGAVEDDWIAAGMPADEASQRAILQAVKDE